MIIYLSSKETILHSILQFSNMSVIATEMFFIILYNQSSFYDAIKMIDVMLHLKMIDVMIHLKMARRSRNMLW
jgi:hypothetical protein